MSKLSFKKTRALGCLALALGLNLMPLHAYQGNSTYSTQDYDDVDANDDLMDDDYDNGIQINDNRFQDNRLQDQKLQGPRLQSANKYQDSTRLNNRMNPNYSNSALGYNDREDVRADYNSNTRNGYANSSDQEISKKIKDKIGAGWFSKGYDTVSYQVNNGAVTLQGYVKTAKDKEKVEKEVRDIDGVRSVNSQIMVQDPSSNSSKKAFPQDTAVTSADNQLNKKIREDVSEGWLWDSYKDVALNTSQGVVTLTGSVSSTKDQQKLIDKIQKVDGVKSVRSNLSVQ